MDHGKAQRDVVGEDVNKGSDLKNRKVSHNWNTGFALQSLLITFYLISNIFHDHV